MNEKLMFSKPLIEVKEKVLSEEISNLDIKPKLLVMQVGDLAESNIYIRNKEKACSRVGINFELKKLEESVTESELILEIERANENASITGILVQMPLPSHIDSTVVINKISPKKDVDGLTYINAGKLSYNEECLTSCTPLGVINLLKYYNVDFRGKHAVIIGRSNIVGKPLANLLLKEDATVTICHSKSNNLMDITKTADILIVAIGKKQFITKDYIKENAIIVDVGISSIDGKIYGDVDLEDVIDKCSLITPMPKGVGPMTIVTLLENVLYAYKKMN